MGGRSDRLRNAGRSLWTIDVEPGWRLNCFRRRITVQTVRSTGGRRDSEAAFPASCIGVDARI